VEKEEGKGERQNEASSLRMPCPIRKGRKKEEKERLKRVFGLDHLFGRFLPMVGGGKKEKKEGKGEGEENRQKTPGPDLQHGAAYITER